MKVLARGRDAALVLSFLLLVAVGIAFAIPGKDSQVVPDDDESGMSEDLQIEDDDEDPLVCFPLGEQTCMPGEEGCCDDEIACTVDTCGAGGCEFAPDDSLCDDDDVCTVDACRPMGCTNTAVETDPNVCSGSVQGICTSPPGQPCFVDGDCDIAETCVGEQLGSCAVTNDPCFDDGDCSDVCAD